MTKKRSPVPWMGGKQYTCQRILDLFPPAHSYSLYAELFGGGASVLLNKPRGAHQEVYNDVNKDLVNFWIQARDHAEVLQARCASLPYARSLYYDYHKSLFDGTELEPAERAVRWFYVLRSSFRASVEQSPNGWLNGVQPPLHSHSYQTAVDLFAAVAERFRQVEIECRDFAAVAEQYVHPFGPRTLFYADPPYMGHEQYYQTGPVGETSQMFHERLARVLNATPAMVILSYYAHPALAELYPAQRWRRVDYQSIKHSQRTKATRDSVAEVLLCNYPEERKEEGGWI